MTAGLPPARKHLGQNFLIDPNIVRKIVAAAALRPDETVLEIGPGRGAMTRLLCEQAARVMAVEIDPQLCAHLRSTLADCPTLSLDEADALVWSFEQVPPGTVVVANLPYYVSTPLLFRLLEARARLSRAVIMLQAEVAQRIVAPPGSKDYGVLSVMTQIAADVSVLFRVSPNCFRPRPDVASSVLSLTMRPVLAEGLPDQLLPLFGRVVRGAFAHRRKTVVNSLRDEGHDVGVTSAVLEAMGVPLSVRAESLSVGQFSDLTRRLASDQASRVSP